MKTPEEIKRSLECSAAQVDGRCEEYAACVCCPLFAEDVGMEDITDYIRQLEAQVPKWISVEDHTPMNEDEVLILINGKNINIGWFNEQCGVWHVSSNCILVEVTHWMPLPKLPKEYER